MSTQALAVTRKEDTIQVQTLMKPVATPAQLIAYHESMTSIIRDALKEGVDYGTVPGSRKKGLFKAGAERLNIAFGTHPEYELVEKEAHHDRENTYTDKYKGNLKSLGLYRYIYKCKITKSDGTSIGEGEGSCSTLEQKYISRPRDMENTVVKMAQKRAFVAATLHAFGLSDRFTQDAEDMHQEAPVTVVDIPKSSIDTFDTAKPDHLDKLEKGLKRDHPNLSAKHYDAIAVELHGKAFSKASVDEIIKRVSEKE
jgi:hypothetical protein